MGIRRSLGIAALSVIITLLASGSAVADSRAQSYPNLAANTCRTLSTEGMGTGVWQVTGTFMATVTWYVSADGTNFLPIDAATAAAPGTAVNSTANTAGAWSAAVAGYRQMQACITNYSSGTVNLYLSAVDTGGGGGGGGGAAGASDTTEATQLLVLSELEDINISTAAFRVGLGSVAGTIGSFSGLPAALATIEVDPVTGDPITYGTVWVTGIPYDPVTDGIVPLLRGLTTAADQIVVNDSLVTPTADHYGAQRMLPSIGGVDLTATGTALNVNVTNAGSGGTALADDADFADGTTQGTPIGGVAESAAPTTVTEGDFGWAAITLNRALKVALYAADGTAVPLSTAGTGAVDANTSRVVIATDDPVNDALVNLDSALNADEGAFTYTTTQVLAIGAVAESTTDALADNTVGAVSMTLNRYLRTAPGAAPVGGGTPLSYISAGATEDEHAVCTAPCTLYSILVTNTNAAARYLKCENDNAAGTAPGTDTPELRVALMPTGGAAYSIPVGAAFGGNGLTCWLVTGAADSDVAEVAANEIMVNYVTGQ